MYMLIIEYLSFHTRKDTHGLQDAAHPDTVRGERRIDPVVHTLSHHPIRCLASS